MALHIKIWLSILLLAILAAPMLFSEKELADTARRELGMVRTALGEAHTRSIVENANQIYTDLFIKSGTIKALRAKTTSESARQEAGEALGSSFYVFTSAMNTYLLSMIGLTYITLLRLSVLLIWLPFLAPFLLAAVVEGVVKHKVLHSSVSVSNPVKFAIAGHAVVFGAGFPLFYLFMPFAISPFFIVGGAIFMALSLMLLISQMAPLSYK